MSEANEGGHTNSALRAKIGFEMRKIRLSLEAILPVRPLKDPQSTTSRYKIILASVKVAGLVEPLVVHPQKDKAGAYLLIDGHLRYYALRELGETAADCIISTDDESFTYNARINRVAPIQEHKMIMKAIQSGVSDERIAAALNLPVKVIRASMALLNGVHEEAAEMLKDKVISAQVIRLLRRVKPLRQIEIAEMMINTNNYAIGYVEAMILTTPKDQLVKPEEPKKKTGMTAEAIAKMEEEMAHLERDIKAIDQNYGENMLNLTVLRNYIKRLLDNGKVVRFLNGNHPDVLSEFEAIAAAENL